MAKKNRLKPIAQWRTSSGQLWIKVFQFKDGAREMTVEEEDEDGVVFSVVLAIHRSEMEEVISILEKARAFMPSMAEVPPAPMSEDLMEDEDEEGEGEETDEEEGDEEEELEDEEEEVSANGARTGHRK